MASQPFEWHYTEFEDDNYHINGRTLFFIILLLALILLLTILILYTRWMSRCFPVAAGRSSHAPPPQPVIQLSHQGLDTTTINKLPITLYGTICSCNVGGEAECCICLGVFQDGDKVKILPVCGHSFHSECVDKWLRTQSNCPLCRASLRWDSPV